jgi:hypothetical protein
LGFPCRRIRIAARSPAGIGKNAKTSRTWLSKLPGAGCLFEFYVLCNYRS